MSIPLSTLYTTEQNPYELTLVAGHDGLTREVSWIQVMEDGEYASFLMPDELIFTTAMASHGSSQWLKQFIVSLIDAGTTGLVLNVGKYMMPGQITADVIELCNERAFPLFQMPWHIRLADVTQAFLSKLFQTKQEEYDRIAACKDVLFTKTPAPQSWEILALAGFTRNQSYQVIQVAAPHVPEAQLTKYKSTLNNRLSTYLLFPTATGYVLLFPIQREGEAQEIIAILRGLTPDLQYGGGMVVPTLDQIGISYTQAGQALEWARYERKDGQFFADLGIYALLFSETNELAMRQLHDRYLGELLAYDAAHHRNLYDTLDAFLRHDGSLQAIAAETFSHRNTILYRMKKIKALLHCDFRDGNSFFTYHLACAIHHFLQRKP